MFIVSNLSNFLVLTSNLENLESCFLSFLVVCTLCDSFDDRCVFGQMKIDLPSSALQSLYRGRGMDVGNRLRVYEKWRMN